MKIKNLCFLAIFLLSILVLGCDSKNTKPTIQNSSTPNKSISIDLENKSPDAKINDCPYIFYEQNKIVIKWIEAGELIEKVYSNENFKKLKIKSCEDFKAQYLKIKPVATIDIQQNFKGVSKIAIVSDTHGQHDLFINLLKANKIIDEKRNWIYGNGHFVIVGDVFDRGDKVTETLWFLYKLEQQVIKEDGKVHLLLGNHGASRKRKICRQKIPAGFRKNRKTSCGTIWQKHAIREIVKNQTCSSYH